MQLMIKWGFIQSRKRYIHALAGNTISSLINLPIGSKGRPKGERRLCFGAGRKK